MNWRRFVAAVGLGLSQLRESRGRTLLAVTGVAFAVVLMVLLSGLGYGMSTTGQEALTYIDQDIWITQGPLELAPGTVGGVENTLVDAHHVSRQIETQRGVKRAEAISFQAVYVSANGSAFQSVVGVGVTGRDQSFTLTNAFEQGDVHYANGSYDGPMTHEVVISDGTARMLNVSVGDSIFVGGTLATARNHEFRIVQVKPGYSNFLGAPTVVMHLSELQEVTGTTTADRATMIGVTLEPHSNVDQVQSDIQTRYPELTVRTQREQYRAVFENQGAILASSVTLVIVAILAGVGLVGNVLALTVHQQRAEIAALRATGLRRNTLLMSIASQGVFISVFGALSGIALVPFIAAGVNTAVNSFIGFPNLIKTPLWVMTIGFGVAICIGSLGAVIAALRLASISPLLHIDQ